MPKAKQRRVYADTVAPTPEWLAKGPSVEVEASIDNANSRRGKTVQRQSWALAWRRYGWVSDEQCRALVAYQALNAACHYGAVRGCLAPRTGGGGDLPAVTAMARRRFDELARALSIKPGHSIAWSVFEWLDGDGPPDFSESFGAGNAESKRRGVAMIRTVADRLGELL